MRDGDEHALSIATLRYRVIAAAVEAADEAITAAVSEAAGREYSDPYGKSARFTERTLWRWLRAYRKGGIAALRPRRRKDHGRLRALSPEILERAKALRRENPERSTRTLIDILVREKRVRRKSIARSTLDRHLDHAGLSRRSLRKTGNKVFRKIETTAPFELVVVDFHHGPYVRARAGDEALHRARLCAFIDHYSRFAPFAMYLLAEDFAALRFCFRRMLAAYGLPVKLFADQGAAFHSNRFHAACSALDINMVHSKPYAAESRGVIERFNRTIKEEFESEVHGRPEPLTLDELNAFFEAFLAERYHKDIHSETGEAPHDRFTSAFVLRPSPDGSLVDELLRLREKRTVHRRWSTVEVEGMRYLVDPSLRGRRVHVLYDPFDPAYVLVEYDGKIVERALPQKAGAVPPQPAPPPTAGPPTDYLAMIRADYERRSRAELKSVRLQSPPVAVEIALSDLLALLQRCRGSVLADAERSEISAFFRKYRPIDQDAARATCDAHIRRHGHGLHVRVYLDAIKAYLVRTRTKGVKK